MDRTRLKGAGETAASSAKRGGTKCSRPTPQAVSLSLEGSGATGLAVPQYILRMLLILLSICLDEVARSPRNETTQPRE